MRDSNLTTGLDAIIEAMDDRLDELAATGDRRERFLLMYRIFKGEIRRHLQSGRFRDPEWAEATACRMGELYFEADRVYRHDDDACPAPWAYAFDSARRRRTNLLQDMLLGMNAHINYDLPLGTYHTMLRFGDVDELRRGGGTSLRFRRLLRRRYHDFLLINEIAWESIPLIQDQVTDRFNPLLKYVNILSFRFSRHIAERIICEYRDRAWAHTLVLITSEDDDAFEPTRRHLSLFSLRAATAVDRLSLNPLRHFRRARRPDPEPGSVKPVARVLVRHLGYRPTRPIAREALIEYGQEVQPTLLRIMDQAPPLANVRAELYGILAAHPTPAALTALTRALPREREARGTLLRVLAGLGGGVDREPMIEPAMAVAREELRIARRLLALLAGIGVEDRRGTLLDRALRRRVHTALCQTRDALLTAGRPSPTDLPDCHDVLVGIPSVAELGIAARGLATAVGESPLDPDPPASDDAAARLLEEPDGWVRACAVWWVATRRPNTAALEERLRKDDHELVKETALKGLSRLLPPSALKAAAEALLQRPTYAPDTLALTLARQILNDEVTMITTIEKVLHLKNVELFQDVLAEDLVTIARVAAEHRCPAGETLIRKDEPGSATYVVVDGEVEVRGLDGQQLAAVGPGGVLGEMSVVSDLPTSADCIATTDVLALRISRTDFHALLQDHPTTAIGVMHVLASRLRKTNERAGELAATPA